MTSLVILDNKNRLAGLIFINNNKDKSERPLSLRYTHIYKHTMIHSSFNCINFPGAGLNLGDMPEDHLLSVCNWLETEMSLTHL